MSGGTLQVVRVVAAVVQKDGRYLVCQRPPEKRHGGLWEFPGGKVEPRESLLAAARRELAEELNVDVVSIGEVLYRRQDPGSEFQIEFVSAEIRGDPEALEHSAVAWVSIAELKSLSLAPSDEVFASSLPL